MSLLVPRDRPRPPDKPYQAVVDAAGDATIEIRPPGSYIWVIHQLSVALPTAPIGSRCQVFKNGIYYCTAVATGDPLEASSEKTALRLWPGDTATIEWTGCTPGDVATALVTYEEQAP